MRDVGERIAKLEKSYLEEIPTGTSCGGGRRVAVKERLFSHSSYAVCRERGVGGLHEEQAGGEGSSEEGGCSFDVMNCNFEVPCRLNLM